MNRAINAALIAAYRAGGFFSDALTAYENSAFVKPPANASWASVFFLPAQNSSLSLDSNEHSGVMQIDVNAPTNIGAGAVISVADNIMSVFRHGASFTAAGQRVEVASTSISPGRVVDGWYRVSVSVFYRAFVPR